MAKIIFSLLYLYIIITQASPIQLSTTNHLSNIDQLSNTTQVKTERSLFKRVWPKIISEKDTYLLEDIPNEWVLRLKKTSDKQPKGCRETEQLHGYWIQSCCYKGGEPSKAFTESRWGTARELKAIAKYFMANPNYYRKNFAETGKCTAGKYEDHLIERACMSWSSAPEFEISDLLQWYIIYEGLRCSDMERSARIHIVPVDGDRRINVCISDQPGCPAPDQDRVPRCGSNDVHGNKLPCPDPPPEHKKILPQEYFEPWADQPENKTYQPPGKNDIYGNLMPFPAKPDFYDKLDISNCSRNDENGNKIPCPEKPPHQNITQLPSVAKQLADEIPYLDGS